MTQTETQVEQNAEDIELMNQAIAEVDRYRNMDRLIPSYHNIVTIATLEVNCSSLVSRNLAESLSSVLRDVEYRWNDSCG